MTCRPEERLERLWRRLAPEQWPVPPASLPPGSALVGGAVRDALLGRLAPKPDLDLVVPGDAVLLARRLAERQGGAVVVLDRERSIARLVLRGWTVDLARRQGDDLQQDLLRRDYSVNALALTLPVPGGDGTPGIAGREAAGAAIAGAAPPERAATPELLDPSGGEQDLAQGRLRAICEANLLADPLRLLRGVRLAWELGLRLEPLTEAWIHRHHSQLAAVAGERILAELERLAACPQGHQGLAQALALGLVGEAEDPPPPLGSIPAREAGREQKPDREEPPGCEEAPEREREPRGEPDPRGEPAQRRLRDLAELHSEGARQRGLEPAEAGWALPLARLATVLDPAGLTRLRASRRLQQSCQRLRRWRQELAAAGDNPDRLAEGARYALQRDLESDLPALVLLADPAWGPEALRRWRDPNDPLFHPRPPLDGAALQARLGLAPGPRLGALLDHLCRERAFGRLTDVTPDNDGQILTQARRWLNDQAEGRHG